MTQGLCERDDLPEAFVKWADSQGYGPVQAASWYADDDVALHYADDTVRLVPNMHTNSGHNKLASAQHDKLAIRAATRGDGTAAL